MGRKNPRALLAVVNALWILQASLPLLDRRLPTLFSFPLSQLLSLIVGALLVLRFRSLLVDVQLSARGPRSVDPCPRRGVVGDKYKAPGPELSQGQLDPFTNSVFLALSCVWSMGLGIHAASVIIENELTPDHALHSLVHHHLHRFWSHNMFGCGFFGLLLLLMWTEVNNSSHTRPSQVVHEFNDEPSFTHNPHENSPSEMENASPPTTNKLWFVWAVILGLIYSIVAKATHTVALTTTFYIATVLLWSIMRRNLLWTSIIYSVSLSSVTGIFVLVFLQ